ncbi:bet1-like protein At4g14600 isoform X2 [Rhodamnia argentea]|uniref:Bet1-like protein At4g14600 isoform X2 n=1 Tax=Rhodamnia argentea TaxID=178133 RepID=A0ABM3H2U0_9MYRT|nr:bet1-like protein At4g14600 isoform X2 [Rhodamnia argentea]
MAGISDGGGPLYGGAVPFRSHQGLMPRVAARSDEFVLQIDPVDGGLDHEVGGLCRQVHQLRNVAQEIDREAKFQNDMLNQLQLTLIKARAGVMSNIRRLNKSIVHCGSNHAIHIVVFALIRVFSVYVRYKIFG